MQSGGGDSTSTGHALSLLLWPGSSAKGHQGLPTAMREPCPGSKSTSVSLLRRMVVCSIGGSSQLRNISLQCSCQWEMESLDEESRNKEKGERKQDQETQQCHTAGIGEKCSWGAMGEGLQEPPALSRSTNTRSVYPEELRAERLPGGDP